MPYINKDEREMYDGDVNGILEKWELSSLTDVAGGFTYVVFRLMKVFNTRFWARALGIGCLVMAILEMYRTEHGTYEEIRRVENGDVK